VAKTMSVQSSSANSQYSRVVFGMPISLLWGYIAMAIFMTGDGIELAHLSRYLYDLGY
jgi:hypothetical protein